jgi:hypothetical protein
MIHLVFNSIDFQNRINENKCKNFDSEFFELMGSFYKCIPLCVNISIDVPHSLKFSGEIHYSLSFVNCMRVRFSSCLYSVLFQHLHNSPETAFQDTGKKKVFITSKRIHFINQSSQSSTLIRHNILQIFIKKRYAIFL